jgi:hypothetical protein
MDNDEAESIGTTDVESSVHYAARKCGIVMLLLAYSAALGVIVWFLPEEDTPLDFVVGLPLLILGIAWCFTDAAQRDHRIGRLMGLLLVLLFVVGLPIYLFQTRGSGAFKSLLLLAVLIGAMLACLLLTAFATLYGGEAVGFWEVAS